MDVQTHREDDRLGASWNRARRARAGCGLLSHSAGRRAAGESFPSIFSIVVTRTRSEQYQHTDQEWRIGMALPDRNGTPAWFLWQGGCRNLRMICA